jgi:NAD(P)H dehydrogenase (quinone)
MKINIIFHSIYGHIYRLAEAVAEVAGQISGTQQGGTALRLWGGD